MADRPAFTLMRRLLPQSQAWRTAIGTKVRALFDGSSESHEDARDYIDDVYDDLLPAQTRALADWERQFGLLGTGTDAGRRQQLEAAWSATGGQSAPYIQDVLQAAGFQVWVHECWASPGVAHDPRDYTNVPMFGTAQCGEALAQCGEPKALCNRFLANDPRYIVNRRLIDDAPPPVPSDANAWPFFLYVGGQTFGDDAYLAASDRTAFEELLLRLRPSHLWVVTMITWMEPLLIDGDPLLIDGEPLLIPI